jgi:hypothetical protein
MLVVNADHLNLDQSCKSPNLENFEIPICEFQNKMSFGCEPHEEAQSIL